MATQNHTLKTIPLDLIKKIGVHNSEKEFQEKDPKVYEIVKWFVNASSEEQEAFKEHLKLLDAGEKQEVQS